MFVTKWSIIAIQINSKDVFIHPQDVLLVMNVIKSKKMYLNERQQFWAPICLPGINSQEFCQFFGYFFSENIGIAIISSDATNEMLYDLTQSRQKITTELESKGLLEKLE